ncbi:MAG: YbaB/EbfC family nucleoid-associated protein [Oscillospiraceae bacterium]|jgi:DNA-binding YbaB/EbfC family protein|nr:YbaB/EbfC family nucleoid-associated protein [Oscillospiraceae bacterium]
MKARIPNAGAGGNMMKKIQDMQAEMERVQKELEERDYTASAGGGVVEVTCNGRHELKNIKIDPSAVDPEDVEMLEDFIMLAVNSAISKAADMMDQEMGKITGGLNIPGMPGMF